MTRPIILSDSLKADISLLVEEGHTSDSIASLLNIPKSWVRGYMTSKIYRKYKKGPSFITELKPIPAYCPKCGSDCIVEPVLSDSEDGEQYYLPLNTGIFSVLCLKGHRWEYDWSKHLAKKERKEDEDARILAAKKWKQEKRDNAMLPVRGEETTEVEHTLDNATEAGRSQVSSTHRRSWRSDFIKQRGERDTKRASHQPGSEGSKSDSGD